MDTERIRMIVEKVKLNRARYNNFEEYGTESIPGKPDDVNEIVEDNAADENDDEVESNDEVESEDTVQKGDEKCESDNTNLVNALLSSAPDLKLNGKHASVLMTLIYLFRMDTTKFESHREIAINTGQAFSTIERHIKYLRDNGFIETDIVTDALGSRMVYSFDGLKQTLKDLGAEV